MFVVPLTILSVIAMVVGSYDISSAKSISAPAALFRSYRHSYVQIDIGLCLPGLESATDDTCYPGRSCNNKDPIKLAYWFSDPQERNYVRLSNNTETIWPHTGLDCWHSKLVPLDDGTFFRNLSDHKNNVLHIGFDYEHVTYELRFGLDSDEIMASYVWLDGEPIDFGTKIVCLGGCEPNKKKEPDDHDTYSLFCKRTRHILFSEEDCRKEKEKHDNEYKNPPLETPAYMSLRTAKALLFGVSLLFDFWSEAPTGARLKGAAIESRFVKSRLPDLPAGVRGTRILDTKTGNSVTVRGSRPITSLENSAFREIKQLDKVGKTGTKIELGVGVETNSRH